MVGLNIGVLFLFAVVGGFALLFARRWNPGSPGRRPELRSRLVRVACALAGGGILVAFLWGTLDTEQRGMTVNGPQNLRVPTLPLPEPSRVDEDQRQGRFLLHVVLVRTGQADGRPLAAETFDLHWPQDRDRRIVLRADVGSANLEVAETLGHIQLTGGRNWFIDGRRSLRLESAHSSRTSIGGLHTPSFDDLGQAGGEPKLFSIWRTPREELEVLVNLTLIRDEDPLREGAEEDLLAMVPKTNGRKDWRNAGPIEYRSSRRPQGSPAEGLVRVLSFNVFPLLAAAGLLAQLFRRRQLGFVKVVACIILYLAALDRLSLRIAESSVRDASVPLASRLSACTRMTSTAFFPKTARAHLQELAGEGSVPSPVRALAASLVHGAPFDEDN